MEWLLIFRVASLNSINNQPNLFSIQTSKSLARRGNVKVLLYTLKPKFCADICMKMPQLVVLTDSTISHMEKEQEQNLPRSCQGQSRSKEKRSIPIPTSRGSIAVLGQANVVQITASTTQLSYTENEGQAVSYYPPFCVCRFFQVM